MLAPCIWPRLVLAQAEIEALRSELRAARDGEERAYEALKRLRTRSQTQTRASSRARNALVVESSSIVQHTTSNMPSPASAKMEQPSICKVAKVTTGEVTERSKSPTRGLQGEERVFSGPVTSPVSSDIIRGMLFKELQGTHERLTAAALREEQLRMQLENARQMLTIETSRSSESDDGFHRLLHTERDDLRREVAKRDRHIAELLAQLEEEQLKCARHRDVAATVQLPLPSRLSLVHACQRRAAVYEFVLLATTFRFFRDVSSHLDSLKERVLIVARAGRIVRCPVSGGGEGGDAQASGAAQRPEVMPRQCHRQPKP
jgi:hypothetical protein